jgi:transposase
MKTYEIKLTRSQRDELVLVHQNTYEKRYAYRINAILLLDQGYTKEEVSRILMLDRNTIRNFARRYLEYGVEGLLDDNYTGSAGYLSKAEQEALVKELNQNLYTTAQQVISHIKNTYGVMYTNDAMVKLLHRLGFVYKKTKGVPAKADTQAQKQFIEEYEKLRKELKKGEKIYFLDAAHPVHQSRPDYAWIPKGKERAIPTISGRHRININGVYSPCDQETIIRRQKRVTARSTLALLKDIAKKHSDLDRIVIVHDQGRAYMAKWLHERLPPNIEMRKLPAYSPNLNLIERLWKLFRKDTMNNKYHETFAAFKKEATKFFKSLRGRKEELKILLAENFQIIDSS